MPDGTHTIILFKNFKHKLLKKIVTFFGEGGLRPPPPGEASVPARGEAFGPTGKEGKIFRVKKLH